ncbi:MAG TPA: carbohydrate-binding family 9-like protein [Hanamia sp.]
MKNVIKVLLILTIAYSFSRKIDMKKVSIYNVYKLSKPMKIDGIWDKPQWKNIKAIDINNYMGEIPKYRPTAQAKMKYDNDNLYIIFRVRRDYYVSCLTQTLNGPVWEDAAVEFFFSPDSSLPQDYFNIEINCGGTPLMGYNSSSKRKSILLDTNDIRKIIIAHSLPHKIDSEIVGPLTWTVECKIPLSVLECCSEVTRPKSNVVWRANFYQIASSGSNPHYITWSFVDNIKPNFHLPEFFGKLRFQ